MPEAAGDVGDVARRTSVLGYATLRAGEVGQALAIFENAIGLARARGYARVVVGATGGLAAAIAACGEIPVGVRIYAAIAAWEQAHGFTRDPTTPAWRDRTPPWRQRSRTRRTRTRSPRAAN